MGSSTASVKTPSADDPASWTITEKLESRGESVTHARQILTERCARLPATLVFDLALVVSELVTNAVRHGQPQIVIELSASLGSVTVTVTDHGPGVPTAKPPSDTATTGRGLAIVEEIAAFWGCSPLDDQPGKAVWATMRTLPVSA